MVRRTRKIQTLVTTLTLEIEETEEVRVEEDLAISTILGKIWPLIIECLVSVFRTDSE
jgi:hypothetical protein